MIFFPYRAEVELLKLPILTILTIIICIITLYMQESSAQNTQRLVTNFCEQNDDVSFRMNLKKVTGQSSQYACEELLYMRLFDAEADAKFERMIVESDTVAGFSSSDSDQYLRDFFSERFYSFDNLQTSDLTANIAYYPNKISIARMFSATIAHADWSHLIGNLFFFFAFAATVEAVIGSGRFLMLYAVLAVGTALLYSLFTMADGQPAPTIGLSGVVSGMIGAFAYLMPKVHIKCFFWFLVFIRFFSIPAWILAVWFFGWDLYGQMTMSETSNVNFIAHLSGAVIGFFFAALFLRKIKEEVAPQ